METSSILDHLEGTVLDRLNSVTWSRPLRAVALIDVQDPQPIPEGSVALVVGVTDTGSFEAALIRAIADGASAIVVRQRVTGSAQEAIATAELPVYRLAHGATWLHVSGLITEGLHDQAGAGGEATDLYELCDSLAAMLQAPVTIEDLTSRVVAFSRDQTRTDDGRRQTILGMRVPDAFLHSAAMNDAIARLALSDRPVALRDIPGARARWALRVAVGENVLGSIWAIKDGPLSADQERLWTESARIVGLAMTRARLATDAADRARSSLVAELLAGGVRARQAAAQLGVRGDPLLVVALGARGDSDEALVLAESERRTKALQAHLRALAPRAVAALIGNATYAVEPLRSVDDRYAFASLISDFAARYRGDSRVVAGVGSVVSDASDVGLSRADADAALRVLLEDAAGKRAIATLDDVWLGNAVLTLADAHAAGRREPMPALRRLRDYDLDHRAALVATVRAWLDAFGDIAAAAELVGVHSNTFRYRLARAAEVGGLDLRDPDSRLAMELQLRIFADLPPGD